MPLILISGYPSSGKTFRSKQLIAYFESKITSGTSTSTGADTTSNNEGDSKPAAPADSRLSKLKVIHINDDNLGLSRSAYASAKTEKDARAGFSSAIKRHLARDTIVVADGMNYIKGFRYQLYCEAKAVLTPSCVVHVAAPADVAQRWNEEALASRSSGSTTSTSTPASTTAEITSPTSTSTPAGNSTPYLIDSHISDRGDEIKEPYDPEVLTNLIYRYEEPNGMTRWDSPLFVIPHTDDDPPYEQIWETLIGSNPSSLRTVKPNAATVLRPAAESGYLYQLDRVTGEIVNAISAWVKEHEGEEGGEVVVPGVDESVSLPMGTKVGLPMLQRLRRGFIGLNRVNETEKKRIGVLFVDYLNDSFDK